MSAATLVRAMVAWLTLAALTFVALPARAYSPPAIEGPVTDTAGKLSTADKRFLNDRLRAYKTASGNEITVLLAGSLGGESIDDVAYQTFRAWKLGAKGADNGVLLVIAPAERKVRIETGKGVGGSLTDLQANDIIRTKISPHLKENRFREAIADGTDAIAAALGGAGGTPRPVTPTAPQKTSGGSIVLTVLFVGFIFTLIVISVILSIIRRARRMLSPSTYFPGSSGRDYGGGYSGGSDYGSGSSGDSGGSGGGDWGGGGGDSGGGGSSDSY